MLNDPFFGLNNQNFLHDVCQELNWINIHIHFRTPLFCGTIDCPKYRTIIIEQGNTGLQSADAQAYAKHFDTVVLSTVRQSCFVIVCVYSWKGVSWLSCVINVY